MAVVAYIPVGKLIAYLLRSWHFCVTPYVGIQVGGVVVSRVRVGYIYRMMHPTWICKYFDHLTPAELYGILQLRSEVFVVEQNCVFLDADDKDQSAWHLMGLGSDKLVAYSRILPAGIAFVEPSIGRVLTSPSVRGSGIGKELMRQSLSRLHELFGNVPIRMGAQLYLKQFYESFGFVQDGDVYLEDGIEHIEMELKRIDRVP